MVSRTKHRRRFGGINFTIFCSICRKTDAMKGCINTFLVEVDPCLAENQKSSKYTVQNISEAILKFVCENEGDHIACKCVAVLSVCEISKCYWRMCVTKTNDTSILIKKNIRIFCVSDVKLVNYRVSWICSIVNYFYPLTFIFFALVLHIEFIIGFSSKSQ